jgi:hypothetical protein
MPILYKVGGNWRTLTPRIKVTGTWRTLAAGWIKVGNVWRRWQ